MSFAALASSGPLVVAVGVAALAGLVSFLSPCVLPLVPGYLSYVTGMAGADLDAALGTDPHGRPVEASGEKARGRILAGGLLFVAGFTVVFTLTGVLVA
ncbi:MAG: cytochrome c biogenesis protein CcdA, partial [Actinobacteria bacterium]